MAATAGARFVRLRGRDVTLRTWVAGANDPDYDEPTWVATDATVKAVRETPRNPRTVTTETGEETPVVAIFHLAEGDEPAIAQGIERPVVVDGGEEFRVHFVGPPEGGVRRLFATKER